MGERHYTSAEIEDLLKEWEGPTIRANTAVTIPLAGKYACRGCKARYDTYRLLALHILRSKDGSHTGCQNWAATYLTLHRKY